MLGFFHASHMPSTAFSSHNQKTNLLLLSVFGPRHCMKFVTLLDDVEALNLKICKLRIRVSLLPDVISFQQAWWASEVVQSEFDVLNHQYTLNVLS